MFESDFANSRGIREHTTASWPMRYLGFECPFYLMRLNFIRDRMCLRGRQSTCLKAAPTREVFMFQTPGNHIPWPSLTRISNIKSPRNFPYLPNPPPGPARSANTNDSDLRSSHTLRQ